MFTGLIREIGTLRGRRPAGGGLRLDIAAPRLAPGLGLGDSVAVDGICLTVTRTAGPLFSVEAAAESRRLTTLESWRVGRRLHLEPALRAGDALDGHLVQGHVDGVGAVIAARRAPGGGVLLTVRAAPEQLRYLTPKGSVAVDGVSLTVDEGPFRDRFTVNLIPHTLQWTTFAAARPGRRVNLEMDVLVKAARGGGFAALPHLDDDAPAAAAPPRSWTIDRLLAHGFGRAGRKGQR